MRSTSDQYSIPNYYSWKSKRNSWFSHWIIDSNSLWLWSWDKGLFYSFPWFYRWMMYYQLPNLLSMRVTSLEIVRRYRRYSKTYKTYFLRFEQASWSSHWRFRELRTHFWTHSKCCWISHMILKSDIISRKRKRCLFRWRNWYLECLFSTWLSWWFAFFRARWLNKY